jgi:hypothetical protein
MERLGVLAAHLGQPQPPSAIHRHSSAVSSQLSAHHAASAATTGTPLVTDAMRRQFRDSGFAIIPRCADPATVRY